jgi:hypothetical protein
MREIKYYISALFLSLFSRRFYADLMKNRSDLGLRYLLFLSLVIAAPLAVEAKYLLSNIFKAQSGSAGENLEQILKQVPKITVENESFKIDSDVNKNIYSKSGNLIAIFDVENKIDDLDKYEKVLIINQHGIRFKFAEDAVVMVLLAGEIEQSFKQYFSDEGKNKSGLDIVRLFEDFRMILEMPYMLIVIFLAMVFFVKNIFSALAYSFVVGIMIVTRVQKWYF